MQKQSRFGRDRSCGNLEKAAEAERGHAAATKIAELLSKETGDCVREDLLKATKTCRETVQGVMPECVASSPRSRSDTVGEMMDSNIWERCCDGASMVDADELSGRWDKERLLMTQMT